MDNWDVGLGKMIPYKITHGGHGPLELQWSVDHHLYLLPDYALEDGCISNVVAGSPTRTLSSILLECDDDGRCACKDNVEGASCDRCADGAFGLGEDDLAA